MKKIKENSISKKETTPTLLASQTSQAPQGYFVIIKLFNYIAEDINYLLLTWNLSIKGTVPASSGGRDIDSVIGVLQMNIQTKKIV